MKVKTIGVIGRTAYDTELCDGQTVKTRILIDELRNKYPHASIQIVDTYGYKNKPFKIISGIFGCLKTSQVVFVLLSRNGMRVIFPIVNSLNRFFKRPILHDCIGGSLDELVKKRRGLKKNLNKFSVNWVESNGLKERLESLGVCNVECLPNFKRLKKLEEHDLPKYNEEPIRFCTFSRVNKAKGIGIASETTIAINRKAGYKRCFLDIYGPIEENYDLTLKQYIEKSDGAISYKGIVNYSESVDTLKNYYALLFPTTFYGEGFPGTLLDAFSAGIPVIATNWHLNGEIIEHKQTGFLYEWEHSEKLEMWMQYAIDNPDLINSMKKKCLQKAESYSPDSVINIIDERIANLIS